jgi:hypothetical protein
VAKDRDASGSFTEQEQSNPSGLIFVPDGPKRRSPKRQRPRPVIVYRKPEHVAQATPAIVAGTVLKQQIARAQAKTKKAPREPLEEAFSYDGSEDYTGDVVKGIVAVSYLLDSISDIGNKDVDARIAQGLAYALRHFAKNTRRYLTEASRLKEVEYRLQAAERLQD